MERSSQTSSALNRRFSAAWAAIRASHAALAGCPAAAPDKPPGTRGVVSRGISCCRTVIAGASAHRRVLAPDVLARVLVRGVAGDVVAAVRVRARLAGGLVAVLGLDQ